MSKVKKTDVKVKPVPAAKVPKNLEDLYKFIAAKICNRRFYDDESSTDIYAEYRQADKACREIERRLEAEIYDNPELKAAEKLRDDLKRLAEIRQKGLEKRLERIYLKVKSGRNIEEAVDELVALANEVLGGDDAPETPPADAQTAPQ